MLNLSEKARTLRAFFIGVWGSCKPAHHILHGYVLY
jgi:hypothetical protein